MQSRPRQPRGLSVQEILRMDNMRSVTSPELELLILFPVLNEFRVAEFLYFYISPFLFQFFFLSALHCLFFICGFGLQHWYPPNFLSFSNDSNIYQAIKSFTTKFQANLIMTTLLSGIFFICSFYFVIYYDIISRFFFPVLALQLAFGFIYATEQ